MPSRGTLDREDTLPSTMKKAALEVRPEQEEEEEEEEEEEDEEEEDEEDEEEEEDEEGSEVLNASVISSVTDRLG